MEWIGYRQLQSSYYGFFVFKLHLYKLLRILRWMSEHIRQNRIRNECIKEKVGVALNVEDGRIQP